VPDRVAQDALDVVSRRGAAQYGILHHFADSLVGGLDVFCKQRWRRALSRGLSVERMRDLGSQEQDPIPIPRGGYYSTRLAVNSRSPRGVFIVTLMVSPSIVAS